MTYRTNNLLAFRFFHVLDLSNRQKQHVECYKYQIYQNSDWISQPILNRCVSKSLNIIKELLDCCSVVLLQVFDSALSCDYTERTVRALLLFNGSFLNTKRLHQPWLHDLYDTHNILTSCSSAVHLYAVLILNCPSFFTNAPSVKSLFGTKAI